MRTLHVDFDMDYYQEGKLFPIVVTEELFTEITEQGYNVKYLLQNDEFEQGTDWISKPDYLDLDDIAGKALVYILDQVTSFDDLPPGLQNIIENKLAFEYIKQLIDEEGLANMN